MNLRLPTKVGILGGGQLARMLALQGHQLGLEVHILSEKPEDPARAVTRFWSQGTPTSISDLPIFAAPLEVLTFESEFFDAKLLKKRLAGTKCTVFPSLDCMQQIQDRVLQKSLLKAHGIPTAPFVVPDSKKQASLALASHPRWVFKSRTGGYDGYGTFHIKSEKDFLQLDLQKLHKSHYIAEQFISFKKEVAAMFVRSTKGQTLVLPLVESQQKDSRCDWIFGPLQHSKWPSVQKKILTMMKKINYVGVLGVELFDTGKDLLVNELAPRVHNSGHYSMDALSICQFELHWRAGLGLDLPPVEILQKNFLMINLIGQKHSSTLAAPTDLEGRLHWYGKKDSKPGRKMGHLNYLGKSKQALLKKALHERKKFKI